MGSNATVTVEPTTDETYIKSVFLNPEIYATIRDDSCPTDPALLNGLDFKAIPGIFLKVLVGGKPEGLFWFTWSGAGVDSHLGMTENCRGNRAVKAARAAVKWIFGNTQAAFLAAHVWSDSPAVEWICRKAGLKKIGVSAYPNKRNGRAVDMIEYSIKREDLSWAS